MSYESNFSAAKFNRTFKKDVAVYAENRQIFTHTGKLTDGKIQIVLASGAKYVDEMDEIAKSVHSLLTSCGYFC